MLSLLGGTSPALRSGRQMQRHDHIPGVYTVPNASRIAMPKREVSKSAYRSLSTSSGGRRWKPVVFRTASTPRQITVETVELRSRTEVLV
jgi:hypothetical protein